MNWNKLTFLWVSGAQCLHEGETRYYCVKKGRFAAVLYRAERYIRNFHLKGPDWGALKAEKRHIREKHIHCSYGLCPRDRGKRALKAGKRYIRGAFYLISIVNPCSAKFERSRRKLSIDVTEYRPILKFPKILATPFYFHVPKPGKT